MNSPHPAAAVEEAAPLEDASATVEVPDEEAAEPTRAPRRGSVLHADGVTVSDPHRLLLPTTSVVVGRGEVLAAVGDPGVGHSALALVLGGRLTPDAGTVTLGGETSSRALQDAVALVDVPAVSEPDGEVPIGVVVGEELAMAGRRAGRAAVAAALAEAGVEVDPRTRTDSVPAAVRVRLLLQLAARRPGTQFLVLTLPERWGVLPPAWEPTARALAEEGFGVLVTTGLAAAHHLTVPTTPIGPDPAELAGNHPEEERA